MKQGLLINDESQIGNEILAYLVDHQKAQDTLEGIVEWWLLERSIKFQVAQVEKALAVLVEKGFVREQSGRNGRKRYEINQRKHTQIKAFLDRRLNDPECSSNSGQFDL